MEKTKRIKINGVTYYKYKGYTIKNYGYYSPDRRNWWEAVDDKTNCGDFHAHTLKSIVKLINEDINQTP